MVSQENESFKDFTAIECKVRILHMFQLQREIECNRGFESEDDDDDYESEDDDDYDSQDEDDYDTQEDTQDDSEDDDDAEPTGEKDSSPRRYKTSEFPLFSPTFWGNSTNGNEMTNPCVTPMLKDTSASRYRTSEFPFFSSSFWGESKNGKGMTDASASITSNVGKDVVDPVPIAHEGPKLVPARQPIKLGMTLTSDDIGDTVRSFLQEYKMEKMVTDIGRSNTSVNKYTGIPTFGKVRQRSLPPISKRQECHMTTRQKSLPPIEQRRKPKTVETFTSNKKDNTGRSRTAETMPVLARDPNLQPSKPRFQGGPYEAKPFKLLPPIATKSGGKNAKDKNAAGGHQKKRNPSPIKVRHTKKSAQIEQKAKAKRDAENEGGRKASANVKPPFVRVPVSSAPKSKSIASCITVPDWSTPKHKKLPPIRKMEDRAYASPPKSVNTKNKFNPSKSSAVIGVTSVVAAMSEKIGTTEVSTNDGISPRSSSRASKSSQSSDIRRSRTDHTSRSLKSRSSSSTRSKKSSRAPSSCRSSRIDGALRSACSHEVRKSARVNTPGSSKYTKRDDANESSKEPGPCTPTKSRCVSSRSRRDRKPRSPSSSRSGLHTESQNMKDKYDGNIPDNEYSYSPMSTARSSVHTNRFQSVLSDTARTCNSASNASRDVPMHKPSSQSHRIITKSEPTRQHIPSRPNTAPVSQTDVLPHPNTASSYPNSARHSSISVRPTKASLLRQKSISIRQSIAPDSVHRGTASGRQSIASFHPSIAPVRSATMGVRQTYTSVGHITEQTRPTTAPGRPKTTAASTTALVSPTTAPSRRSTTSSRQSTTSSSKIPLRIATSPGKTSARSSIPSAMSAISSAKSTIPSARSVISSDRSPIPSARSGISSAPSVRSTCSRNSTAVLKTPVTAAY